MKKQTYTRGSLLLQATRLDLKISLGAWLEKRCLMTPFLTTLFSAYVIWLVFAISFQVGATNWPITPLVNFSMVRHVVLPVHFAKEMHWDVIIVKLQHGAHVAAISVTMYQPLQDTRGKYRRKMKTVWEDNFRGWSDGTSSLQVKWISHLWLSRI